VSVVFPPVTELSLVGVIDAGVPNQERILLRPTQIVNLGEFGVLLGKPQPAGLATPFLDNFLWFGEVTIGPPSWIFVYTGPGQWQRTRLAETNEDAFVAHWGRNQTVFHDPEIVPIIVRIAGVLVGGPPLATVPPQATKRGLLADALRKKA
jgi:hypothetical protein